MSTSVKDISQMALGMSERSRAILADLLLDSLEESTTESHEAAWLELAMKRNAEFESGTAPSKTYEEIMASAREALRCAR